MVKRSLIAAVLVPTWLIATSVQAAWALSVSPPRTEILLSPGEAGTAVLTVSNPHPEPYDVELSQKPWFIYPDNKTIQVEDWLLLPEPRKFRLKPGKSREVKLKIKCPTNAVGELMGMVSFAYQGMEPGMITPMISTAIYLEVKGTQRQTGEVVKLGAGMRNGRFQVGAQIKATGNTRLVPKGTILLKGEKDKTVGIYTLAETNPIFPGVVKDCAMVGPSTLPTPGHYTLEADFTSGTLEFRGKQGLAIKASGEVILE